MVVNTQYWNWQKIKGNGDGKCAIKSGLVKYHGRVEADPGRAGDAEQWKCEGPEVQQQPVNRLLGRARETQGMSGSGTKPLVEQS